MALPGEMKKSHAAPMARQPQHSLESRCGPAVERSGRRWSRRVWGYAVEEWRRRPMKESGADGPAGRRWGGGAGGRADGPAGRRWSGRADEEWRGKALGELEADADEGGLGGQG